MFYTKDSFLHDLLDAMIKQHGAEKIKTRLAQLHAEMSISNASKRKEIACDRCGDDLTITPHYCM